MPVSGHTSNLKFDGLNFPPGGAKLFEQKWPSFLTPSGQALVTTENISLVKGQQVKGLIA